LNTTITTNNIHLDIVSFLFQYIDLLSPQQLSKYLYEQKDKELLLCYIAYQSITPKMKDIPIPLDDSSTQKSIIQPLPIQLNPVEALRNFLTADTLIFPANSIQADYFINNFADIYGTLYPESPLGKETKQYRRKFFHSLLFLNFQQCEMNRIQQPTESTITKASYQDFKHLLDQSNSLNDAFIKNVFDEITTNPIEPKLSYPDGLHIPTNNCDSNKITKLNSILTNKNRYTTPTIPEFWCPPECNAIMQKTRPWAAILFGISDSIVIQDNEQQEVFSLNLYNPGLLAASLFGKQSYINIIPNKNNPKSHEHISKFIHTLKNTTMQNTNHYNNKSQDVINTTQQPKEDYPHDNQESSIIIQNKSRPKNK